MDTTVKAIAILVFLLLTAPVAAHMISRAAYHRGVTLYRKTWIDELNDVNRIKRGKTDSVFDTERHVDGVD